MAMAKGEATRRYLGKKFNEKTFTISNYAQQRSPKCPIF